MQKALELYRAALRAGLNLEDPQTIQHRGGGGSPVLTGAIITGRSRGAFFSRMDIIRAFGWIYVGVVLWPLINGLVSLLRTLTDLGLLSMGPRVVSVCLFIPKGSKKGQGCPKAPLGFSRCLRYASWTPSLQDHTIYVAAWGSTDTRKI